MSSRVQDNAIVRRVVSFGRVLREAGLEVGPARLQDAVNALAALDVTARDDVYWALRCTLCSKFEDIEAFDARFDPFWRRWIDDDVPAAARPSPAASEEGGEPDAETARRLELVSASDESPDETAGEHGRGSSATERLLDLEFREYGPQEIRDARWLVERIARSLPLRRSHRLEAARGGRHVDMRRTLREAMRTGGHPLQRSWRKNRMTPRRTVFLLDISGSMAPYARPMVMFAQAAVSAGRSVEAFAFGTRLTRLTRHLGGTDPDRALAEVARAVPDWAGGTRIGESVAAFNAHWGRRGISRGALVIIVSDGWERGDPSLLRAELASLHRSAYAVVWVNPLAGDPRYRPVAKGMAAALPSADVFLPGHSLRALTDLASVLEALPDRRGRPLRAGAPAAGGVH
jgi:uncharacterized protein with von Willebrand factor type A (vWA) domain